VSWAWLCRGRSAARAGSPRSSRGQGAKLGGAARSCAHGASPLLALLRQALHIRTLPAPEYRLRLSLCAKANLARERQEYGCAPPAPPPQAPLHGQQEAFDNQPQSRAASSCRAESPERSPPPLCARSRQSQASHGGDGVRSSVRARESARWHDPDSHSATCEGRGEHCCRDRTRARALASASLCPRSKGPRPDAGRARWLRRPCARAARDPDRTRAARVGFGVLVPAQQGTPTRRGPRELASASLCPRSKRTLRPDRSCPRLRCRRVGTPPSEGACSYRLPAAAQAFRCRSRVLRREKT
jgi:hypothetical protein